ncbi:hypothetical protein BRYFOR_07033 [Marvinbryantia formatexigens DSM 14469]|uniref:Uncharacterized protein n=1 Tax=Marvinbryantia formatexigens DSM 14469 TaxID=478749 RepID=C6LEI3_9FIRM|nr:hypothetical protein BRYFOR_07033 [Marvinbryantia formatexigens DSM 14469]
MGVIRRAVYKPLHAAAAPVWFLYLPIRIAQIRSGYNVNFAAAWS